MQKFGLLVPHIRNFKKFMLIMKLCTLILVISLATASAKIDEEKKDVAKAEADLKKENSDIFIVARSNTYR